MEDDVDTSPGGEYYTSPNSPASSSRNWQEDLEGGEHPLWSSTQSLRYSFVMSKDSAYCSSVSTSLFCHVEDTGYPPTLQ